MGWPNEIRFDCPECGLRHSLGVIEKGVMESEAPCHSCGARVLVKFFVEVVKQEKVPV